jgi:phytoene/squalene synthetase
LTTYWTEEQVRESVRKALENNYGIRESLEEYGYSGAEVEGAVLNELLNMTPGFTMTMDLSKRPNKGYMG